MLIQTRTLVYYETKNAPTDNNIKYILSQNNKVNRTIIFSGLKQYHHSQYTVLWDYNLIYSCWRKDRMNIEGYTHMLNVNFIRQYFGLWYENTTNIIMAHIFHFNAYNKFHWLSLGNDLIFNWVGTTAFLIHSNQDKQNGGYKCNTVTNKTVMIPLRLHKTNYQFWWFMNKHTIDRERR